jgi:hypothetical protein
MHCIVLPVKFYGMLSISVLRNEQLFTKHWGCKTDQFLKSLNFQTFQPPPFGKRIDHFLEKVPIFLDRQSTIKFNMDLEVPFIYRLIQRNLGFRESIVFFDTTPISRFWRGASFSVHGGIRHKSACFWLSVGIYSLHRGACKI